jgi:hypothetical protein
MLHAANSNKLLLLADWEEETTMVVVLMMMMMMNIAAWSVPRHVSRPTRKGKWVDHPQFADHTAPFRVVVTTMMMMAAAVFLIPNAFLLLQRLTVDATASAFAAHHHQ